ncbi:DUF5518 domain-containing protein [Halomicroarcula sp. GCM10025709]|uniref:DUF5518 domain-containing protein n=1 Tax=Haloarcula TaxID=2237 RepID=UPI0024C45960|nr:DUF5518 domain-containing protein [Halomicroarcula sp. YJ-61-S]
MTRIGSLHELSDTWRFALLGGVLSIPFTLTSYWQSGSEMSLSSVFFAAILVGYLAKQRGLRSSAVGVRTGVVGSLPTVWVAWDMVTALAALDGPTWFVTGGSIAMLLFVLVVLGIVAGISAVFGALGGRVGGWLAERNGGGNRPAAGH